MYHWQVYIRLQKKQQAWWEDVVKENNKKRKECKMNKETPIPSQQWSPPGNFTTYAKIVTPHKNENFQHRLHAPDREKYLK